ncbi:hypothetical protein GCM10025771_27810 [Niveibacterium umoris]|uniref:C-terminal processing protease CtpA/Prc n=1 Tax=Niveibacterium umoris TaxID=1193620 RepID=A0A840BI79_9RHOO|nr:PDZ domain-containing protein [Niveibacterium umoris]MBB4012024.1 C-terminal processing protease CtpA/Prc [Niveibacterium umoris]
MENRILCFVRNVVGILLAGGLILLPIYAQAAEGGGKPIGFAVRVSTEGIFSTKVEKVEVAKVEPGSQAEAAGIAIGDELVRVEGMRVPGGDGVKLKPLMHFSPGEPKHLAFKRKDGSGYDVTLLKAP